MHEAKFTTWPQFWQALYSPAQATSFFLTFTVRNMDLSSLPASFSRFLEENNVDPIVYTVKNLPRFVRWNTRFPKTELPTAEQLQAQLNGQRVWPVKGIEGFFGIDVLDTQDIEGTVDDKNQGFRIIDIPA
jgi:lipopolysaccharide export LptBFGC system permease protein LptF